MVKTIKASRTRATSLSESRNREIEHQKCYLENFVLELRKLRNEKGFELTDGTRFHYSHLLSDLLINSSRSEDYIFYFPASIRPRVKKLIGILNDCSLYRFFRKAFEKPIDSDLANEPLIQKRIAENKKHFEELERNKQDREEEIRKFLFKFRGIKRQKTIEEILEITDERLLNLFKKIKPVYLKEDGKLYEIIGYKPERKSINLYFGDVESLREVSFIWGPLIYGKQRDDLERLCQINTLHTCGYASFFKPSISEVLVQIPKRYLDKVVAFETGRRDEDIKGGSSGSYHRAKTILYRRKK